MALSVRLCKSEKAGGDQTNPWSLDIHHPDGQGKAWILWRAGVDGREAETIWATSTSSSDSADSSQAGKAFLGALGDEFVAEGLEVQAVAVPPDALPIAQRVLLQVDSGARDGPEISALRRSLIAHRAVLRRGRRHGRWRVLDVEVGTAGEQFLDPSPEWEPARWRSWLIAHGFGAVTAATQISALPSESRWKVAPAMVVEETLKQALDHGQARSTALVVGPNVAAALSQIASFAEGRARRTAVLSAAGLLQVGSDLAAIRRWLLAHADAQDGAVIVLVRPTEWFTGRVAADLAGLLRQVVDRCEWRYPSSTRGLATLVSLLSAPPAASWQAAFDQVLSLEWELGVLSEADSKPSLAVEGVARESGRKWWRPSHALLRRARWSVSIRQDLHLGSFEYNAYQGHGHAGGWLDQCRHRGHPVGSQKAL
ncbi:unnamed protein product [Effrenium voratum]|nr:unnamed protein product [Effrenium voratum]